MTSIVYRVNGALLNTMLLPLNSNCNSKTTCETVQTAPSHLCKQARIILPMQMMLSIVLIVISRNFLIKTNIIRIRNLYVGGIDPICDANIMTKISINDASVNYNSKVVLDIDKTCSFGDKCNIYRKSIESCTNMFLVCNGICYNYLPVAIITIHQLVFQCIYSSLVRMSFIRMYLVRKVELLSQLISC